MYRTRAERRHFDKVHKKRARRRMLDNWGTNYWKSEFMDFVLTERSIGINARTRERGCNCVQCNMEKRKPTPNEIRSEIELQEELDDWDRISSNDFYNFYEFMDWDYEEEYDIRWGIDDDTWDEFVVG